MVTKPKKTAADAAEKVTEQVEVTEKKIELKSDESVSGKNITLSSSELEALIQSAVKKAIGESKPLVMSEDKLENKRLKAIEKNDGWCRFHRVEVNDDGTWKDVGNYWANQATSKASEGNLKQAATKAAKSLVEYNVADDGSYTLANGTVTVLLHEQYTDFAIPVTVEYALVEKKPVQQKDGTDRFAKYTSLLKPVKFIIGEKVELDLTKRIKQIQTPKKAQ